MKTVLIWVALGCIIVGSLIVIRGPGGDGKAIVRAPVERHITVAPGVHISLADLPVDYCGM